MAEGTSSSATVDVECGTTLLIKKKPKKRFETEIKEVQTSFLKIVNSITTDNKPTKLEEFKKLLTDAGKDKLKKLYDQQWKDLEKVTTHIPERRSFLHCFGLQGVLSKMLNDIAKYAEFLKLLIEHFAAYNECIEHKYLLRDETEKDKTKKQRRPIINNDQRTMRELDTPLHCAVRQLNEGFIEWLLKQPETEVNLRNKRRETALAILCQMYDCVSKLKTRLEDIGKEREKADEKQQIKLDGEKIEVSAQMKELEEEMTMNAPTILKLIKMLLVKEADFNIYMNEGALPFDFLRKYYTEGVLDEIINSYAKSNIAMTEKPPKQLNASDEGKNVSKKRIVKFYKKTEDMDVRVTVELLETFIHFNDLEKFKHYWKDFKVTSANVKKVITLLLHVAVELNYTPYVDHIINKASTEIFKVEENKVTNMEDPTRLVTPERNHIRWCCLTGCPKKRHSSLAVSTDKLRQNETIEPLVNTPDSYGNRAETKPPNDKQPSCWCCFKCCQKRRYPGSQTQSEGIGLSVITSDSQDQCELLSKPHTSAVVSSRTQDETFQLEKNETENSQDTCAGTSKKLSVKAGGSCIKNPSATEGAEPQTQSGTSKLPVTDLHMESGISKLKGNVPQMHSETIEFQDNNPNSQDNHVAMPEGTHTSHEQPSGWCCLKCFQKKQNPPLPDGTNPQAQRQNSKDCRLPKAEENKMVHRTELKGLLKTVCLNGNITLLNMFLKKMDDRLLVNENPLLINTLNLAYTMKQKKESTSLLECMKILINKYKKVDMYRADKNRNTALHLALSYEFDTIALLMLKKVHGLMGFKNRQNLTPIEYGTTEFWNTYLNKCITMNNETELSFNVGFLKPRMTNESSDISKSSFSKRFSRWIKRGKEMNETHNSKYRITRTVNDMTALRLISQSTDRKEFLMHPVIIAFITMKWKRLFHWHILNLLLTAITMGTFIGYTLMPCPSGGWTYRIVPGAGAFIIFLREIMQWFLLGWSYFTLENVVDIMNVVLIGIVVFCGCDRGGMCEAVPSLSSFVFVSLALQATFLLGATWNNLSITLYMFKTVSSSFFYSFLSFSPVIVAFICSFYRMYNEPSGISISNGTKSNSSEENFNNFHSAWDATIKTLVMTTGEFEAANINYDGARLLLFVAFLFIAPIVILNLINGLAVSDIAAIRQESEFISIGRKVKLLELYERAIVESRSTMSGCLQWLFREPLLPSPFFENYESIIYVMLNEKNKLAIKIKDQVKKTKEATPSFPWLPSWFFKYYNGIRSFQLVPSMSLDQAYANKAKAIAKSHSKNNSGRGTNELVALEQTDRPALVNKTAMNQHNTMSLSRSATGPSVPESRDKQIEMLQEQVRNMIAMLNDMQHQLSGSYASKAESSANTSGDHSRAQ